MRSDDRAANTPGVAAFLERQRSDDGADGAIQRDRGCMAALPASMVDVVAGDADRVDRVSRWSAARSSPCSASGGRAAGADSGCPLSPTSGALHYVASAVIGGFFLGGMIRMASNQVLGRAPRIEDLFSVVDVGFDLLAGAVFYGAATFLASMLCVIPGFIVSGLLMFTIPLIVIARSRPPTPSPRAGASSPPNG